MLSDYLSNSESKERVATKESVYQEEATRAKIAAIVRDLLASPEPSYAQIAHAHNDCLANSPWQS